MNGQNCHRKDPCQDQLSNWAGHIRSPVMVARKHRFAWGSALAGLAQPPEATRNASLIRLAFNPAQFAMSHALPEASSRTPLEPRAAATLRTALDARRTSNSPASAPRPAALPPAPPAPALPSSARSLLTARDRLERRLRALLPGRVSG